jgi:putative membrane protein
MRNVFKIFFSDLKAISRSFFALVITGSVLILPALYAWVNIYANGNPYANTGNVPIALASRDKGYTTVDGTYVNKGREIIESIAESTSIKWIIVDDADEAIADTEAGKYYGVIVMNENLSRNMYDMTAALSDDTPSITFYQNAKTNAIANKISTTAANTAEHNIQVNYTAIVIETLVEKVKDSVVDIADDEKVDNLINTLTHLRDTLVEYDAVIAGLAIMSPEIVPNLEKSAVAVQNSALTEEQLGTEEDVQNSIGVAKDNTIARLNEIENKLNQMLEDTNNNDTAALAEDAASTEESLQGLRDSMPDTSDNVAGVSVINTSLDSSISTVQGILSETQALNVFQGNLTDEQKQAIADRIEKVSTTLDSTTRNGIDILFDDLALNSDLIYNLMVSVNGLVADVPSLIMATKDTVTSIQGTLNQLRAFLQSGSKAADALLQDITFMRDNGMLSDIVGMFDSDPKELAEFLVEPVQVETTTIYPVQDYGSAMTPFYSTLAIWVGGVVLGSIFKVHASKDGLRNPKDRHLFWGRFLTYFFLGQLQAAIIVWGDIHLIGCQCIEPKLLYLCAAVTSFVFICIIYSLILAFGDVGKAIVVVIMIIQIAGSSGSYPIEILPEIFTGIYLFFPFPYAINAMREAICGLYQYDIYKYLAELMIFGIFGLLIGLVVKKSVAPVTHFLEEDMEETGVL